MSEPGIIVLLPSAYAHGDEEQPRVYEFGVHFFEQTLQEMGWDTVAAVTCIHHVRFDADCVLCDLLDTQENEAVPYDVQFAISRETMDKIGRKTLHAIRKARERARMN